MNQNQVGNEYKGLGIIIRITGVGDDGRFKCFIIGPDDDAFLGETISLSKGFVRDKFTLMQEEHITEISKNYSI